MPEAKIIFINKSATSKKLTQSEGAERRRIFSHVQRPIPTLPRTVRQCAPPLLGRLDTTGMEILTHAVSNQSDLKLSFPRSRKAKAKSRQPDMAVTIPVQPVPSPIDALNSAQVDPFDSLRVPISLYMKDIFAFYNSDLVARVFPNKAVALASREHTMSLALQDPILLNTLLCTSSAAIYRFTGSTTYGLAAMKFQGEALRRLRAKLETPEATVDISSIYAVSMLIWVECLHGTVQGLKAHLAGLEGLVARIGDISDNPLTVISTIWNHSNQCSAVLGIRPNLVPVVLCEDQISHPARDALQSIADSSKTHGPGSRFFTGSNVSILGLQLAAIIKEQSGILQLQSFGAFLESRFTEADYSFMYTKKMALEYDLLCVRFDHPLTPAQDAVRLAAFVIVQPIILFIPSTATFSRTMAGQIKAALRRCERVGFWSIWESSEDLLLWVLFVGAFLSEGRDQNAWFVTRMAQAMGRLEIDTKARLLNLLMEFYYWPEHFRSGFEKVWPHIEASIESR